MIKPSPGRIVWFYPELAQRDPNGQPLAAIVAKVIDDRVLNLAVFAADGTTYPLQHVTLLQDGDELADPNQAHACWMPYQKGQAAKTEAAIAASPSLEPLQKQVAEFAASIDGKIHNFGESLDPIFGEIAKRLMTLEVKATGAAGIAPAPQSEAGGTNQSPPAPAPQPAQ